MARTRLPRWKLSPDCSNAVSTRTADGARRALTWNDCQAPAIMTRLQGLAASRGSALGRARVRRPHVQDIGEKRIAAAAVDQELQRLHRATDAARAEMRRSEEHTSELQSRE